ncbi:MAG: hypothetical protein KDD70_03980 [Bdellovibrionales bacterium]|nr:hypothetical protein [Bdellovibrionales bacterium]
MASLLKSKNRDAVRKSNLVGGAVVGLVILAFFFLPELLNLGGGGEDQGETVVVLATPSPSPEIDSLLTLEEEKVAEGQKEIAQDIAALPVADTSATPKRRFETVQDVDRELALVKAEQEAIEQGRSPIQQQIASAECVPCGQEASAPQEEQALIPREGPISWEHLTAPAVVALVDQVTAASRQLMVEIPQDKTQSRYELLSYLEALRILRVGPENGVLGPEEALRFADFRDAVVSQTFEKESVDRLIRKRWQEVSLSPILRDSFAAREKARIQKPYNPKMNILEVLAQHFWVPDENRWREAPLQVDLNGTLVGDDTERLEWYLGAEPEAPNYAVLEGPNGGKARKFEIRGIVDVKGKVLTIKAFSSDNRVYVKRYDFYRTMKRLPVHFWNGYFTYKIPYRHDPRVDRLFLVRQGVYAVGTEGELMNQSSGPIARF